MTRFALILMGGMLMSLATPAWAQETETEESEPAQPATYTPATTDAAREKAKLDKLWLERQQGAAPAATGTTSTTTTSSGGTTTVVKTVRGSLSEADLARIQDAVGQAKGHADRSETAAGKAVTAQGKAEEAATRAEEAAKRAEAAANQPDTTDRDSDEEDEDWGDDEDAEDEDESAADERDDDEEPPATGTTDASFSGVAMATGGLAFNGGEVLDSEDNVAAGMLSLPVNAWGGVLYGERGTDDRRGRAYGLVGRAGIDPLSRGINLGLDVMALSTNRKDGAMGVAVGFGYIGHGAIDDGIANAAVYGGDLFFVSRMPLGNPNKRSVTDLMLIGGLTAGALVTDDPTMTTWAIVPTIQVGIGQRFQGDQFEVTARD